MDYLEKSILLDESRIDEQGYWRLDDAFFTMQEMGNEHSTLLCLGRSELMSRYGVVWMLSRVYVRFDRVPARQETVTCHTWPGQATRTSFPRYYEMFDCKGERIGYSSTIWVLVSLSDRKLVLPKSIDCAAHSSSRPPLLNPPKVQRLEGETMVFDITVSQEDIDVNHHVNNTRYIHWLQRALKSLQGETITELTVHYASEVLLGDQVVIEVTTNKNQLFAQYFVRERCAFEASGLFTPERKKHNG